MFMRTVIKISLRNNILCSENNQEFLIFKNMIVGRLESVNYLKKTYLIIQDLIRKNIYNIGI